MFIFIWVLLLFPDFFQRTFVGWSTVGQEWGIVRYADFRARDSWLRDEEHGKWGLQSIPEGTKLAHAPTARHCLRIEI